MYFMLSLHHNPLTAQICESPLLWLRLHSDNVSIEFVFPIIHDDNFIVNLFDSGNYIFHWLWWLGNNLNQMSLPTFLHEVSSYIHVWVSHVQKEKDIGFERSQGNHSGNTGTPQCFRWFQTPHLQCSLQSSEHARSSSESYQLEASCIRRNSWFVFFLSLCHPSKTRRCVFIFVTSRPCCSMWWCNAAIMQNWLQGKLPNDLDISLN